MLGKSRPTQQVAHAPAAHLEGAGPIGPGARRSPARAGAGCSRYRNPARAPRSPAAAAAALRSTEAAVRLRNTAAGEPLNKNESDHHSMQAEWSDRRKQSHMHASSTAASMCQVVQKAQGNYSGMRLARQVMIRMHTVGTRASAVASVSARGWRAVASLWARWGAVPPGRGSSAVRRGRRAVRWLGIAPPLRSHWLFLSFLLLFSLLLQHPYCSPLHKRKMRLRTVESLGAW